MYDTDAADAGNIAGIRDTDALNLHSILQPLSLFLGSPTFRSLYSIRCKLRRCGRTPRWNVESMADRYIHKEVMI